MRDVPVWLFDFDGTLVDSEAVILASFRHATATVLGETPPDDVFRAGIGLTLEEQTKRLAGARADELFRVYVEHNQALHPQLLRGFPGVPEMLGRLAGAGARLGIVTAKIRTTLELGIRCAGLDRAMFEVIVAKEDTERHKPDPTPLLHALRLLGAEPETAVYVGDSPFDVRAAHAAGMVAAAAAWGDIFPREALVAERPDVVYDSPDEIAVEAPA